MTIGPEPISRMLLMSSRLGTGEEIPPHAFHPYLVEFVDGGTGCTGVGGVVEGGGAAGR
jgi:hypothetical protein